MTHYLKKKKKIGCLLKIYWSALYIKVEKSFQPSLNGKLVSLWASNAFSGQFLPRRFESKKRSLPTETDYTQHYKLGSLIWSTQLMQAVTIIWVRRIKRKQIIPLCKGCKEKTRGEEMGHSSAQPGDVVGQTHCWESCTSTGDCALLLLDREGSTMIGGAPMSRARD